MTHDVGNDIISLVFLNFFTSREVRSTMYENTKGINSDFLKKLIGERCSNGDFLSKMRMSQKRFERLIKHRAEATQGEMLRAASVLYLNEAEFMRCFFSL